MSHLERIFANLEVVNLQRLSMLSGPIDSVNQIVKQMSNNVNSIIQILQAASSCVQDQQFQNACNAVKNMCAQLDGNAQELYRAQSAIVQLHEKLRRYEGISSSISTPQRIAISIPNIQVSTDTVIFVRARMVQVHNGIGGFLSESHRICQSLNSISTNGWSDPQSQAFRAYIGVVISNIATGCKVLQQYNGYLGGLLRGL